MSSLFASLSNFSIEKFPETSTKKYENAAFANGIWQKRVEPVGTYVIQVEKTDLKKYGLTQDCSFSFEPNPELPKIPSTILDIVIQHYRDIYATIKSEVYTSIYWDKNKKDYFIYVPKQKVSGAAVVFENDPVMLNNSDYVIVMDIHSHNVMGKC